MSIKKTALTFYPPNFESDIKISFIKDTVSAGFPSPAGDFMENSIDLNKELSKNPLATFYIKVSGNSMIDAGIENDDVLVVDKSLANQVLEILPETYVIGEIIENAGKIILN